MPCSSRPAGASRTCQEMQRQLDKEIEALFKPGGSKPRINAGLAELRKAKEVKRTGVAAQRRVGRARDGPPRRRRGDRGARGPARDGPRREASAGAAQGSLAPAHPGSSAARKSSPRSGRSCRSPSRSRRPGSRRCRAAKPPASTKERADAAIVDLDRRIAELVVPEDLLAEADAIEPLREGLAADRKARKSLPAEEAKLFQALDAASGPAGRVVARPRPERGWSTKGEAPERPAPRATARRAPPGRDRGRRAATALSGPEDRDPEAGHRSDQARHRARTGPQEALRAGRAAPGRAGRAGGASPAQGDRPRSNWRWHRRGTRETWTGRWRSARTRLAQATQQAARSLSQLPLWTGTLEALEAARAPAAETVDRFEAELAQVEPERDQMRKDRQRRSGEKIEAEGTLEQLRQSAGTVPTEDDLAAPAPIATGSGDSSARPGRSAACPPPRGLGDLLDPDQDPAVSPKLLADAFERLKDQADSHADRSAARSGRVAQQAAALASLHRSRQRLDFLDAQEQVPHPPRRGPQRSVARRMGGPGIDPLSPREMRGWLQLRKDLIKQSAEIQERRSEVMVSNASSSRAADGWASSSPPSASPRRAPDESLAALRDARRGGAQASSRKSRPGGASSSRPRASCSGSSTRRRSRFAPSSSVSTPGVISGRPRSPRWASSEDVTTEHAGAMVDQVRRPPGQDQGGPRPPVADRGAPPRRRSSSSATSATSASGSRPS